MRSGTRSRGGSIVATLLVIWLIIGALAAFQRGYFSSANTNCAGVSTTLVTIVAGPLDYVGGHPKGGWPPGPQPGKKSFLGGGPRPPRGGAPGPGRLGPARAW